ncbi:hypothetical protein MMC28_007258 [Mycoblastus sanguinarius]|nr:hypothetical protein [Mycoblastus sanguinarius]
MTPEKLGLPNVLDPAWEYLKVFFRRRWFQRLWVVQEITLAKDVFFMCGAQTLPWEELWKASVFLDKLRHSVGLKALNQRLNLCSKPLASPCGGTVYFIHALHNIYHKKDHDLPLKPLLRWLNGSDDMFHSPCALLNALLGIVRFSQTTDPRDHVYALLGIVNKMLSKSGTITGPVTLIRADYQKSISQVFLETATLIMESTQMFSLLEKVADPTVRNVLDLPSWVPDFTTPGRVSIAFHGHANLNPFGATKCTPLTEKNLDIDDRLLHLNTFPWDCVASVGRPCLEMFKKGYLEDCAKLVSETQETYATINQPPIEVLWRTMLTDQLAKRHPAPPEAVVSFHNWLLVKLIEDIREPKDSIERIEAKIKSLPNLQMLAQTDTSGAIPWYEAIMKYIRLTVNMEQHEVKRELDVFREKAYEFEDPFKALGSYRRMFRTVSGHLGLGPQAMQAGDTVCLISGAPIPFVIRKSPFSKANRYTLVGEAYVHGIMHGEVCPRKTDRWERIGLE